MQGGLPDAEPYWFLYAYLAFLVVLPFLRKIAQQIESRDIILLFCLVFIFTTFLPTLNLVFAYFKISYVGLQGNFSFIAGYFVNLTVFCTLSGYYFDKINIEKVTARCCLLLSLLTVVGILYATIATISEKNIKGNFTHDYLLCSFELWIIPFFILARKIFASRRMPKFIHKFSIIVGPLVFLVYLEDLPLRYLIYPGQLYNKYDLWIAGTHE